MPLNIDVMLLIIEFMLLMIDAAIPLRSGAEEELSEDADIISELAELTLAIDDACFDDGRFDAACDAVA